MIKDGVTLCQTCILFVGRFPVKAAKQVWVSGVQIQAVGLASLLVIGCTSKYEYTPENPRNPTEPPAWTSVPAYITDDGDLEVVGSNTTRDAEIAWDLAEDDARARAAGVFERIATTLSESNAQVLDETVVSKDATVDEVMETIGVNVGGMMPVARFYDTRAGRAYILMRMPARRFERLEAIYGRKAIEDALAKLPPDVLSRG